MNRCGRAETAVRFRRARLLGFTMVLRVPR